MLIYIKDKMHPKNYQKKENMGHDQIFGVGNGF
jgi:hypothetical protein